MELKETVEMMLSKDYKERFKAEYYQLKIRYDRLFEIFLKWSAGQLDFMPTCPKSTYSLQLKSMQDYMAILEARAKMEGIEL